MEKTESEMSEEEDAIHLAKKGASGTRYASEAEDGLCVFHRSVVPKRPHQPLPRLATRRDFDPLSLLLKPTSLPICTLAPSPSSSPAIFSSLPGLP